MFTNHIETKLYRRALGSGLTFILLVALAGGCGRDDGDAAIDDTGVVRLALGAVPSDAGCLTVTVVGSRTVDTKFVSPRRNPS